MRKKLYDIVKDLLVTYPELRNSDRKLLWAVWWKKGLVIGDEPERSFIKRDSFYSAPPSESVTRARRKVQENHPELMASKAVQEARDKKESTKGMFAYHE